MCYNLIMPTGIYKRNEITLEKMRVRMLGNKISLGKKSNLGKHWKIKDISKSLGVHKGEKNGMWKGGKPKCLDCGKELTQYSSKYCNKHKSNGEKSYRYIKDRTLLKKQNRRNDPAYFEWRKQIWLRDNFKCKIRNQDCDGKIEVHHILGWVSYPELRYEINNGITLCHAHHPRKRAEEKRLIPMFRELVAVSK